MGEGATAVNICHQQAGGAGMLRHPHVDDVAAGEVDLGWRARALNDHHIVFSNQRIQCLDDHRPHDGASVTPGHGGQPLVHLAHQHHLAVRVPLGFQQQRVHVHIGYCTCRQRLKILRTANFATRNYPRVVAHVLRLERRNLEALTGVVATQCRGEPALAGAAGGTQHHHTFAGHRLSVHGVTPAAGRATH